MTTLQKMAAAVKRLRTTYIPQAKARRFFLGVEQFSLHEFSSLNAAGRHLGLNRWTGENRIRRLVTDIVLADQLQRLMVSEALASHTGQWYCSLDHSQFGPFCIAILAVSHRKGRAVPIWCQVNVSEAGLIAPLLAALEELFRFLRSNAPDLTLVLVMGLLVCQRQIVYPLHRVRSVLHCPDQERQARAAPVGSELVERTDS